MPGAWYEIRKRHDRKSNPGTIIFRAPRQMSLSAHRR